MRRQDFIKENKELIEGYMASAQRRNYNKQERESQAERCAGYIWEYIQERTKLWDARLG